MPVNMGYGRGSVDFLCCVKGLFVAIEAKRADEPPNPTPRQMDCLTNVGRAGGLAFCTNNLEDAKQHIGDWVYDRTDPLDKLRRIGWKPLK
jgi:hypothetical protein